MDFWHRRSFTWKMKSKSEKYLKEFLPNKIVRFFKGSSLFHVLIFNFNQEIIWRGFTGPLSIRNFKKDDFISNDLDLQ